LTSAAIDTAALVTVTENVRGEAMPESKTAKPSRAWRKWEHQVDVIGLKFRWKRDARQALATAIGVRGIGGIQLVREPDNKYDENAIMVLLPDRLQGGKQLGYIRRESAAMLAPKLDSGELRIVGAKLMELLESDDWNSGPMIVTFQSKP
jgi:HIRAN domain